MGSCGGEQSMRSKNFGGGWCNALSARATGMSGCPGFLRWLALRGWQGEVRESGKIVCALLNGCRIDLQSRRQVRNGMVGTFEVERRGQVSHRGAPPGAQIRDLGPEASLQKTQNRSVIEQIGGDESASTERRNNQHGNSEAEPNRATDRRITGHGRIRKRGRGDVFAGRAWRRGDWRNVVEESAVFVVVHK